MDLEDNLVRLRQIGLSKNEEEVIVISDEPKIPSYLCFPNEEAEKRFKTKNVFGQGFHTNRTLARIKSVGEFLERLCLENPQKDKLFKYKFELGEEFIDPILFCCYSEEQIPDRQKFLLELKNKVYYWFFVKDILSNKKMFLPAQLIFLSEQFDEEFPIRIERISTGAALGPIETENAFETGFLEVIERDACIYSYLTRRRISRIVDLPSRINELVEYLKRYNLETNIFDVTIDLNIPTVMVITTDRTGIGPAVNIGSKADFNYENAIERAVLESIQCRRTARFMKELDYSKQLPKEDEIVSMDHRFYYWYPIERMSNLSFWLDNFNKVSYNQLIEGNTTFKKVIDTFTKLNYHIFIANITLPEIKDKGFEVLKVIIPELHPLYLNERAKALYSVHYGNIPNNPILKPHPLT